MKARAEEARLPLPRYTWDDPCVVLTISRGAEAVVQMLRPQIAERLNADERAAWQFIVGRESVTRSALMSELGVEERKAQRILKKLEVVGLLRRVGRGPATRFEAIG